MKWTIKKKLCHFTCNRNKNPSILSLAEEDNLFENETIFEINLKIKTKKIER